MHATQTTRSYSPITWSCQLMFCARTHILALSHSNQSGYVNRLWSSSLGNMVCQRGGGEVVISGYYTNTVWLCPLDSWTLAGVPWLLGVNLALVSHSSWVSFWTAEELLKTLFCVPRTRKLTSEYEYIVGDSSEDLWGHPRAVSRTFEMHCKQNP